MDTINETKDSLISDLETKKENSSSEDIDSSSNDLSSNVLDSSLFDEIEFSTLHLKPPAFFKTTRRRSKTYSGEILSAQLDKIGQLNNNNNNNSNNNADPKSQEGLNELPILNESTKKTQMVHNSFSSSRSASLQDQLVRRTNFSRKNYGSMELLFTLDREGIIQNIGKFRIENGESREYLNTSNTIHLENPESQTRWYFKYFLGRVHQNYMIEDKNKCIIFLSVVVTDSNDRHIPQYKAILWTKLGSQKLTLPYYHNKQITVKQVLNHFQIEADKLKEIIDPELQKELLVLEEQEGSINFKFGVVYAKHGQLTDDEMLSNEIGSCEFENFINLIGDKIRLKGWKRYRGGLDTCCKC